MQNVTLDDDSSVDQAPDVDTNAAEDEVVHLAPEQIIKSHVIASMALGLVPIPLFDIAALTSTQLSLLKQLCETYEVPFDNFDLKPILTSLIGGSLPIISVVGMSSLVKFLPGFGSIAGMASLSITAGSVTYAVGKVFSRHFENGGTIEDFDVKQARELLKSEFEDAKSIVSSMKDEHADELDASDAPTKSAKAKA